ncbi:MAG: LPS assembly protein LptD [Hydrogenophilales bacterium]|nr:LPS assembly protein LptD [Hydrogenophilales bacterium]
MSSAYAGTNLPALKVDPRLLGLPALEPEAPTPPSAKPAPAPLATPAPSAPPLAAKPLAEPAPAKPIPLPPPVAADKTRSEPAKVVVPPKPAAPPSVAAEKPAPAKLAPPRIEPAPVIAPPMPASVAAVSPEPPALPPLKPDDSPIALQSTLAMPKHDEKSSDPTPTFISAMRLQGKQDEYIEAEEDAELRKLGVYVNADRLRYDEQKEILDAKGNVRLQTTSGVMKGPDLHLKLNDETGYMNTPEYAIAAEQAHGKAEKLTFVGEQQYKMDDASYTTCGVGKEDWWVRANEMEINRSTNEGVGRHAWIEFKGVPLLYTPYISFPLHKQRKSGFLTPSFGTTGNSGAEFSLPYYWNIAPNYDATFTPRLMSKRGLQLGGEFRYLQPNYNGELQAEFLPNDNVTKTNRSAYRLKHGQNFGAGFSGNLDLQKVSDNDYFRDLSSLVAVTSQTTLPREGALNYGNGPWSAGLKIQRYQILQDPINPIVAPYERAPQFTAAYNKLNVLGWADTRAAAEYVAFDHASKVRGTRFTLNPSFSVPFTRAYGHLTPKLGLHYTQYNLDNQSTLLPDATGVVRTYDTGASRALPIFSLDSGLAFERQANLFGQALTQTLEPRVYYLYVPYKDQSRMPIFDSGEADFNFAQIFSENRFAGGDRISDANQATLALTSRFIEADSGQERLRAAVAQRYFFRAPRVALTSAAPTDKISDFLASIGGHISPAWSADAAWQYDPNTSHTKKYNIGTRYNPASGKLANLTYRFNRNTLRQVDLSGQWPVAPRWQVMGRWNYSIQDKKNLETLGGIEYLEGCWAVRVVAHRFQTATQKTTNALFLQLELSGLSSLGTNPLNVLKQNIGGFTQSKPRADDLNLDEF